MFMSDPGLSTSSGSLAGCSPFAVAFISLKQREQSTGLAGELLNCSELCIFNRGKSNPCLLCQSSVRTSWSDMHKGECRGELGTERCLSRIRQQWFGGRIDSEQLDR